MDRPEDVVGRGTGGGVRLRRNTMTEECERKPENEEN